MIQKTDLLAFNFYKKEKFTGSYQGMRYQIQKESIEDEDFFAVWTWQGPYNFSTTKEKKQKKIFPFEAESLEEIAAYLNEIYEGKNWIQKLRP